MTHPHRPDGHDLLPIGDLARRAGVAASALRFWEAEGLLPPADRTMGNARRYPREVLRRIAFIRAAQRVGLTLDDVRTALATLPDGRTPSAADWSRLSRRWRTTLDRQIEQLTNLRDDLDACIGCGCLSMDRCRLYNPADGAARLGEGARFWLGDSSADVTIGLTTDVTAAPRRASTR